jgi:hypothetical protein
MVTAVILFILYVYLRLRYVRAGRFIFCIFLFIEFCMLVTDCMQWLYAHVFYLLLMIVVIIVLYLEVKSYVRKGKKIPVSR